MAEEIPQKKITINKELNVDLTEYLKENINGKKMAALDLSKSVENIVRQYMKEHS